MTTKRTLLDKLATINQTIEQKKKRAEARQDAKAWRDTKKFIKKELPLHLPIIKKRVLEAAKKGECSIDLFPTGPLGNALLEKLGPGFRADTDTQRYVGGGDGQGWYEGPYIAHTRLIWTLPS